ncbi:MAG: cytochrome c-type biogenesis protein CcmH [Candidatus Puniceispirillaceae bacterium]
MAGAQMIFRSTVMAISLLMMMLAAPPLYAISPEEQLSDPVLEERARALSGQLRCLVCQNQSIEDSDAELAVDLRYEVRRQLVEGKSDAVILDGLRNRYGDYILLNPPVTATTYLLWGAPILIVLFGCGLLWVYRRSSAGTDNARTMETLSEQMSNRDKPAQIDSADDAPSIVMVGGLIVLITIIATTLYSQFGSPELPARPLDGRADEIASTRQAELQQRTALQDALDNARAEAEAAPDSVDSWLKLAMAAARAEAFDTEISALKTALAMTDGNIAVKSMLAEAMARKADGLITLPVRTLIDEVLTEQPDEPRALYLSGLAAFQDEAYPLAIQRWQKLQQISSADAPWIAMIDQNLKQAAEAGGITLPTRQAEDKEASRTSAPLLTAEQVEVVQSMSAEEQQAFILDMTDRLEDRLKQAPDDKAGWQQLIRARQQLGDNEAMLRALTGAADADADNPDARLAILEFLLGARLIADNLVLAEESLDAFRQLAPDRLEGLFFAGQLAQIKGNIEQAAGYWQSLIDKLEGDNQLRPLMEKRLEALRLGTK